MFIVQHETFLNLHSLYVANTCVAGMNIYIYIKSSYNLYPLKTEFARGKGSLEGEDLADTVQQVCSHKGGAKPWTICISNSQPTGYLRPILLVLILGLDHQWYQVVPTHAFG